MSTAIVGSSSGGTPMVSNSLSIRVGAVEVAHLDRRAQRLAQRHALQLDRQRADGGVDVLEAVARLGPVALPRIGDGAPERRVELIADLRIGQLLERIVGPVEHHIGDGLEHGAGDVVGAALIGERHVEHGLGFRRHVAREIEAREIEPRLLALGRAAPWRRAGSDRTGAR